MKITFNYVDTTGKGAIEILAPGGREGPSDFQVDAKGATQLVEPVRAAAAVVFARGNAQTSVKFSVARLFTNYVSAEQHVLDRARLVGLRGDLQCELQGQFGGGGIVIFQDCTCVQSSGSYLGLTAISQYTFLGGKIL